jgi:hypothetical protein
MTGASINAPSCFPFLSRAGKEGTAGTRLRAFFRTDANGTAAQHPDALRLSVHAYFAFGFRNRR